MGEYINLAGRGAVKLGTCESLFYVRRETLRRWIADGDAQIQPGNLEPRDYLKPAHAFRFRFPFPDEDAHAAADGWHDGYDRGWPVSAPAAWMSALQDHNHARAAITLQGTPAKPWYFARQAVTVPCPQATGTEGHSDVLIVAHREIDGQMWTCVQCPYCGGMWRLDPAGAQLLADANAHSRDGETLEVLRRMMQGYGVAWAPPVEAVEGDADRLRALAYARVSETPKLSAHAPALFYDWAEGAEHWRWVATAPVAEIVDWAVTIEQETAGAQLPVEEVHP